MTAVRYRSPTPRLLAPLLAVVLGASVTLAVVLFVPRSAAPGRCSRAGAVAAVRVAAAHRLRVPAGAVSVGHPYSYDGGRRYKIPAGGDEPRPFWTAVCRAGSWRVTGVE